MSCYVIIIIYIMMIIVILNKRSIIGMVQFDLSPLTQ